MIPQLAFISPMSGRVVFAHETFDYDHFKKTFGTAAADNVKKTGRSFVTLLTIRGERTFVAVDVHRAINDLVRRNP